MTAVLSVGTSHQVHLFNEAPGMDQPEHPWRAHWKRVGPLLESIRRRELREMTPEQHRRAMEAVLALANPELGRTRGCGMVELYRRRPRLS